MRRFRSWRWMAVVVVSVCAFLGSQAPAGAATGVDGFTILYAAQSEIAHTCKIIGTSDEGYYQAVVCADLITVPGSGSSYGVYGQLEAYCQTYTGVAVECVGVSTSGIWSGGSGIIDYPNNGCGTLGTSACPSDRFLAPDSAEITFDTDVYCDSDLDSDYQEWTVAVADSTEIILPDSNDVPTWGPSSNWSTGHFWICD
ncbi:MAG: hypothetical protein ABSA93_01005 [Streptosporangiaceae bacterium]|jgi:hypothetical protein